MLALYDYSHIFVWGLCISLKDWKWYRMSVEHCTLAIQWLDILLRVRRQKQCCAQTRHIQSHLSISAPRSKLWGGGERCLKGYYWHAYRTAECMNVKSFSSVWTHAAVNGPGKHCRFVRECPSRTLAEDPDGHRFCPFGDIFISCMLGF
jgi:hypothetical protein